MKQEEDIITIKEVSFMIGASQTDQIKVLIAVLYLTGHRVSEILQLRKEDIWYVNDRLYFHLSVSKRREPFYHDIYVGKTSPFVSIIIRYVESLEPGKLLFESEYNYNEPITRQYVGKILKELNPKAHSHLFRHTRATLFARLGYAEYQIQNWFGWKTSGQASSYVAKGAVLLGDMGEKVA